jgi:hypothetical protein
MPSFIENPKKKIHISAGSEIAANLQVKNLIIDKSLYGLKTSTARKFMYLSELLLTLGFK